jgi:hypothetical protein
MSEQSKCQNPKCLPGDGDEAIAFCERCKVALCDLCAWNHSREADCSRPRGKVNRAC